MMSRYLLPLAVLSCVSFGIASAADTDDKPSKEERHEVRQEAKEHPRLAAAIKELDEAIAELRKAPHDFGGHRDDAVKACENARDQLKQALEYRADKEKK